MSGALEVRAFLTQCKPLSYVCCRWRAAASIAFLYLALLSIMPSIGSTVVHVHVKLQSRQDAQPPARHRDAQPHRPRDRGIGTHSRKDEHQSGSPPGITSRRPNRLTDARVRTRHVNPNPPRTCPRHSGSAQVSGRLRRGRPLMLNWQRVPAYRVPARVPDFRLQYMSTYMYTRRPDHSST